MGFFDSFRPSGRKLFFCLFLTIGWVINIISSPARVACECPPLWTTIDCENYSQFLLAEPNFCYCGCLSMSQLIREYLWDVMLPFAGFYLAASLIAMAYEKVR